MEQTKYGRILIGIVCVLVLILVVTLALFLDSQSPDPIFGIFRPLKDTQPATEPSSVPDEPVVTPDDLPPSVEITPSTGTELSFPCQIPGYGLTIEKLAPYSGMFVEDGTNITVANVAMLLIYNNGDFPVEYTQISIRYGQEELLFDVSALPMGARIVVQEKNGKAIPSGKPSAANAMVVERADMELSEDIISVTDNGDNTLTIRNLTDQIIPTVRVFYKYYMADADVFVGGISFTVRITRLAAGSSITVRPSHYTSTTSRLVMVLTYDSEV